MHENVYVNGAKAIGLPITAARWDNWGRGSLLMNLHEVQTVSLWGIVGVRPSFAVLRIVGAICPTIVLALLGSVLRRPLLDQISIAWMERKSIRR